MRCSLEENQMVEGQKLNHHLCIFTEAECEMKHSPA